MKWLEKFFQDYCTCTASCIQLRTNQRMRWDMSHGSIVTIIAGAPACKTIVQANTLRLYEHERQKYSSQICTIISKQEYSKTEKQLCLNSKFRNSKNETGRLHHIRLFATPFSNRSGSSTVNYDENRKSESRVREDQLSQLRLFIIKVICTSSTANISVEWCSFNVQCTSDRFDRSVTLHLLLCCFTTNKLQHDNASTSNS